MIPVGASGSARTGGRFHPYILVNVLPISMSDADLVARVVTGDERAFTAVYDRHVATVYGAALRLLRDREAAEEVVQETWLALWNRAEHFDAARGSLIGWLLTIARNRALDRLRAASRRPQLVSLESDERDSPLSDVLDRAIAAGQRTGGGSPERDEPLAAVVRAWERSVVRAAVAAMPELERCAIELAYDEGLTQVEIAERLGWPLGTVKTRTRNGLARLRAALEDVLDPFEPAALAAVPDRLTLGRG